MYSHTHAKRKSLFPVVLVVTIGLALAGGGFLYFYKSGRLLLEMTDPAFASVSKQFAEKLDDADWQLVRWWPAKRSPEMHQEIVNRIKIQIAEQKQSHEKLLKLDKRFYNLARAVGSAKESSVKTTLDASDKMEETVLNAAKREAVIEENEKDLAGLERTGPRRLVRIRFRARNKLGAMVLGDWVLMEKDGTWLLLPDEWQERARAEFGG